MMNAESMESWLLALLIRGGAIAVIWCAVVIVFRKASADRLSAWWRCGTMALLIIAFVPWSAVRWWIPVNPPVSSGPPEITMAEVQALPESPDTGSTAPDLTIKPASPALPAWMWMWLIGAGAFLVRLVASHSRVRTIIRSAEVVANPEVRELLRAECCKAGLQRMVTLKLHSNIQTPFAAGWLQPIIVIPAEAQRGGESTLRLMLRHEIAHVLRRDVLWQVLAELAVALHWPNPLAWVQRRRLRLAHESAADDFVLAAGIDGPAYAALLFDMARNDNRYVSEPCLAPMARASALRRRIGLILDGGRSRNVLGRMTRLVLLAGSCIAALAFGLTGLRAQVTPLAPDESWARSYRDTFRLEKSFADHFPGPSEEALTAFRKELAAAGMPASASLKFELSPDKTTLRVESRRRTGRMWRQT